MEAWRFRKHPRPGWRCSAVQMTRWQRPKETYQRGGLSLAGKDFSLQSIQEPQDFLHHALGAGGWVREPSDEEPCRQLRIQPRI